MVLRRAFRLSSGHDIPALGFGTYLPDPSHRPALREALQIALAKGYRSLDSAWKYQTEGLVGDAIRQSGIPRGEIFVTTKMEHHAQAYPKGRGIELKELGSMLGQADTAGPIAFRTEDDGVTVAKHPNGKPIIDEERSEDHSQTWKAMEALVRTNKVHSIGVSNFNTSQLQKLLETAEIPPAVNQIEIHPCPPQLHQFCKDKNIHLTAYSPLGGQHPIDQLGTPLKDETIIEIADSVGKSPAQVIFSWLIQRGHSVISKSIDISRIISNLDVFQLEQKYVRKIEEITLADGQKRFGNWDDLWGTTLFSNETR